MFSIFGKKKQDEAPTTQEAIQKLRGTEELLQKKSDFLETKIQNELVLAKQNASKNKRGMSYIIQCIVDAFDTLKTGRFSHQLLLMHLKERNDLRNSYTKLMGRYRRSNSNEKR